MEAFQATGKPVCFTADQLRKIRKRHLRAIPASADKPTP